MFCFNIIFESCFASPSGELIVENAPKRKYYHNMLARTLNLRLKHFKFAFTLW